jgi:hypothetical protein
MGGSADRSNETQRLRTMKDINLWLLGFLVLSLAVNILLSMLFSGSARQVKHHEELHAILTNQVAAANAARDHARELSDKLLKRSMALTAMLEAMVENKWTISFNHNLSDRTYIIDADNRLIAHGSSIEQALSRAMENRRCALNPQTAIRNDSI